ncbi:MAG: phosphoribosyltransferase family protein [Pyrinomonadaceae bacterium]
MINLIPSPEAVMQILQKTGAYRFGHFVSQCGRHSSHYFKVPMAFHFSDNARVLAVGLSRNFRMDTNISRAVPQISVVSPGADGIPVAFSIRDALSAAQIFWAGHENGTRQFPDYIESFKINPCIIVEDIVKSGSSLRETHKLLTDLGAEIIGFGAIVRFENAPKEIEGIGIKSLVEFNSPIYNSLEEWKSAESNDAPEEKIVEF